MTRYRRTGGLNTGNLFLTVLEAGKSKIKVPANCVPMKGLFLEVEKDGAISCFV
jgi:hypothetical protein